MYALFSLYADWKLFFYQNNDYCILEHSSSFLERFFQNTDELIIYIFGDSSIN